MKRSQKIIAASVVGVLLLAGAAYALLIEGPTTTETSQQTTNTSQKAETVSPSATTESSNSQAAGRYATYTEAAVTDTAYDTTIVFFYAPWCPECRAYKQAIESDTIPEGVQFLEADFDSSTELKKRYGVTLQTTFVRVNTAGELQKKWAGYGKEKSLNVVLENVR